MSGEKRLFSQHEQQTSPSLPVFLGSAERNSKRYMSENRFVTSPFSPQQFTTLTTTRTVDRSPIAAQTRVVEPRFRESEELCTAHGEVIVAIDVADNSLLCEKCVYKGAGKNPQFMATIAKAIKDRFETNFREFERVHAKVENISAAAIKQRLQSKVQGFFEMVHRKISQMEDDVVRSIQGSRNLRELGTMLDDLHVHLDSIGGLKHFEKERESIREKRSEIRYAYLAQRKQYFDDVIQTMEDTTAQMNHVLRETEIKEMKVLNVVPNQEGEVQRLLNEARLLCIKIDVEDVPTQANGTKNSTQ